MHTRSLHGKQLQSNNKRNWSGELKHIIKLECVGVFVAATKGIIWSYANGALACYSLKLEDKLNVSIQVESLFSLDSILSSSAIAKKITIVTKNSFLYTFTLDEERGVIEKKLELQLPDGHLKSFYPSSIGDEIYVLESHGFYTQRLVNNVCEQGVDLYQGQISELFLKFPFETLGHMVMLVNKQRIILIKQNQIVEDVVLKDPLPDVYSSVYFKSTLYFGTVNGLFSITMNGREIGEQVEAVKITALEGDGRVLSYVDFIIHDGIIIALCTCNDNPFFNGLYISNTGGDDDNGFTLTRVEGTRLIGSGDTIFIVQ